MDFTRRTLVGGAVGASAAALAGLTGCSFGTPPGTRSEIAGRPATAVGNAISRENLKAGSTSWRIAGSGLRHADDVGSQVKGFASATSVVHGDRIAFHLATRTPQDVTVTVHRMGWYRGARARLMTTSPRLRCTPQQAPALHAPTGTIRCEWPATWSAEIPTDWPSGLYLASFTSADGHRSATPFVVRDAARQSEFLVVVPFTTYQAYNQYPLDGSLGRSLYFGFLPSAHSAAAQETAPDGRVYPTRAVPHHGYVLHYPERSRAVSFQRPYGAAGLPGQFVIDLDFVAWAEQLGLDVTYADSLDLHDGLVEPAHHKALLFSGHDEYWSAPMRHTVERGVRAGTGMALFAANNMYWKVRIDRGPSGFPVMTCYKSDPDPAAGDQGATTMWRKTAAHGALAEQGVLGNQYNGIVRGSAPLVVSEPRHWFWAGSGVARGDRIADLVRGEADGLTSGMPRPKAAEHVLLSASPFRYTPTRAPVQNSSLYHAPSGAWVFDAGTFGWTAALGGTTRQRDARIQKATANLIRRLRA